MDITPCLVTCVSGGVRRQGVPTAMCCSMSAARPFASWCVPGGCHLWCSGQHCSWWKQLPSCARALGRTHIPINALKINIPSQKSNNFPMYISSSCLWKPPITACFHNSIWQKDEFNCNIQQASDVWYLTQFLITPLSYHPFFHPLMPAGWFLTEEEARKGMRVSS